MSNVTHVNVSCFTCRYVMSQVYIHMYTYTYVYAHTYIHQGEAVELVVRLAFENFFLLKTIPEIMLGS